MPADPEPRRSVRSTKGQHTKPFDQIDPLIESTPKKARRGRKSQDAKQEPEEEVIRCVCGATEQAEDAAEPWIACDKCSVWQHNVCMGMSVFADELPKHYYCEKCSPQNHAELLKAIKRGEKPWEALRLKYEEEKAEQTRRKGGRKPKNKRVSDAKDVKEDAKEDIKEEVKEDIKEDVKGDVEGEIQEDIDVHEPKGISDAMEDEDVSEAQEGQEELVAQSLNNDVDPRDLRDAQDAQDAPDMMELDFAQDGLAEPLHTQAEFSVMVPGGNSEDGPEDMALHEHGGFGKRKSRSSEAADSDLQSPAPKMRKLSESDAAQTPYQAPADLLASISQLPSGRLGPATALMKSLLHALDVAEKAGDYTTEPPSTVQADAERMALEIERALYDENPKEYRVQAQRLVFNLKKNQELCSRLLRQTLTPTDLARMKSEQLASTQLQKEISEIKAKVEKQAILITTEGPRMRRTHKGDEVVEPETFIATEEEPSGIRRPSLRDSLSAPRIESVSASPIEAQPVSAHESPKQHDFDIKTVFSTVKPLSVSHSRLSSGHVHNGPGVDLDVDRLLQEDTGSPPYSPEDGDPDVIWRGNLAMSSVANFNAVAKFVGGANLSVSVGLPWLSLIPKRLTVAGRIDQHKAIEYLCGLRYSDHTDIVVTSLSPSSAACQPEFHALINYFITKRRYGVVGDKGVGNVRDTYLVPVPAGDGDCPEFMLNFSDNLLPKQRSEPMLLVVFVYRNDAAMLQVGGAPSSTAVTDASSYSRPGQDIISTTITTTTIPILPRTSPVFSPTSPRQSPAGAKLGAPFSRPQPEGVIATAPNGGVHEQQETELVGRALAEHVLGPLITSSTVQLLLPQADQMTRKEWEVVKSVYERDPRARDDLLHLGALLEQEAPQAVPSPPHEAMVAGDHVSSVPQVAPGAPAPTAQSA